MPNQEVIKYLNDVISEIAAPEEFNKNLKAELTKLFGQATIDDIMNKFGSPEKLAEEITYKLAARMDEDFKNIIAKTKKQNREASMTRSDSHAKRGPKKPYGEYTCEESDINIKLLYIPLLQISSGTEKIHYYLMDDDDECDDK